MKNKGITLLALIVTVIIMLILASVSIRIITSGGIIDKTKETVTLYNEATEKEELELAKIAATDYVTGNIDKDALEENLPSKFTSPYNFGIPCSLHFSFSSSVASLKL